jgi:hypothetical protein
MGAEDLIARNLCDASDARATASIRMHVSKAVMFQGCHVSWLFAATAVQRRGFTGKCFGIRAAALPNAQSG